MTSSLHELSLAVRSLAARCEPMTAELHAATARTQSLAEEVASLHASDPTRAELHAVAAGLDGAAKSIRSAVAAISETGQRAILYAEHLVAAGSGSGTASGGAERDRPAHVARALDLTTAAHLLATGVDVQGGRAFFESGDPTLVAARRLRDFPGTRKYDLHGDSGGVHIGGRHLDAVEFASVVRSDPDWRGQPLTLFACDTGKRGPSGAIFAQRLSDALGVDVTAPTELAWSNGAPFSSGGIITAAGLVPGPPEGRFVTFTPRLTATVGEK